MLTSYHVHSTWSDGHNAIIDIIRAAGELDLCELGISDHYVITPEGGPVGWSMPLDKLDEYVESVQSASCDAVEGLTIRLGVEADFMPETTEALRNVLASQPFDYVIGSVHIVDGFPIDESDSLWSPLSQDQRDNIIRTYWVRVRQMACSGLFDIAAHLDLYKKFGYYPSVDFSADIEQALDAIAASHMSVELNTSGWHKPCCEEYPSPGILRECLNRSIPVLITADAHSPDELVRSYDRAYALLKEVGYTGTISYAGRQIILHAL
jgi:histidinol-phosphatase (PHP family)